MPGQRIVDVLGAVPAADSTGYPAYVDRWHEHRLGELLFAPEVTVYVSNSGDDNDDGAGACAG